MRLHSFLLMLLAGPMNAAADGQALSLDQAVEYAIASAPQVTAQAEGAAAMRELADSAGRLPDPELMVGVDNLPVTGPDAGSTTADFMTMRGVGVMQEFPRREKLRLQREHASTRALLADAELTETRLDVARETAQAWIRRAAIESALADLRALRPDVELGAMSSRAGVAGGRASTAEALAAEAAIVRLDNRIIEMETEAHHARVELGRWIGDDAERPLAPMPAFDRLPEPLAALLEGVQRHGPLIPFDSRIAAARTDVALARAEKRPDWSASLSYLERGPQFSDMASLQFTIELPLFAKHRQDPVIAARTAELRRLQADRETMLRAHTAELRKTLVDWQQTGVRLEQYDRELLPLARQRATAALASYRTGSGEFQLALDAFEEEIGLAVERALLTDARGRAWAFLRYLESWQLQP